MAEKSTCKEPEGTPGIHGNIFKFIVENSNNGILVILKGTPVFANNKMVTSTGYSKDEILSRPATDFIHCSDNSSMLTDYLNTSGTSHPLDTSFSVRKKNGELIWVELHKTEIDWYGEKATLCFLTDITQHKKYEQELDVFKNNLEQIVEQRTNELQEANKQLSIEFSKRETVESVFRENSDTYRSILDNIQDGFFEISLSGKLTFFNKALCKLSGYTPEELINLHYSKYASEKTAKSLYRVFNKIFTTGETGKIMDYEMIRKDGSVGVLSISVSLIRDNSGKPVGFMGVGRDITAQKEAEKEQERARIELEKRVQERTGELIKANMELLNAKELADESAKAKTEFLANMSHEIRTPLNAIIGMSELLMSPNQPHKQKEYLDIVHSSSISLLELVNDILDYSKIDAGKLDFEHIQFSLYKVVDEIADMFLRKNISKELELVIDIKSDVPAQLSGDPLRLRQILSNLVSNAFKFTEKGEIRITVEIKSIKENTIELLFCIKDSGIGISPALCDKENTSLFNAFAQADGSTTRNYGGTGLGLAICKKIVAMMGGDIWVKSKPGNGSSFYFTALFKQKRKSNIHKPQVPDNIQNKMVLRVEDNPATLMIMNDFIDTSLLLVEDNPINQIVVLEMLKAPGIKIDIANNGKEAIECIRSNKYDAILMDVQMPGMDGIEATKYIREKLNLTDIPIIAMTAHAMYGDNEKCIAAGMSDYISKPVDRHRLFSILKKYALKQSSITKPDTPAAETEKNSLSAPGLNIKEGLKRLGSTWEQYSQILVSFLDTFKNFSNELNTDVSDKNYDDALLKAHTLKGTAGNISANKLQRYSEELERALKAKKTENIIDAFNLVDHELKAVLNSITAISSTSTAEKNNKNLTKNNSGEDQDPSEILCLFPDLYRSIRSSDPVDSSFNFKKIKTFFIAHQTLNRHTHIMEKLEKSISDYNFDMALVFLETLERKVKAP